ncbi:helix-turn-helix domain-containing protein [Streptomyces qinglanensis]|uniref:helix-turn-helix domain-containing protein n=1 Tax=Streptomyces qinglanensis TaxID=943816 RepID=UPI0037A1E79F
MGSQRRTSCKNPVCRNEITYHSGERGRPRLYCSDSCGRTYRRNKSASAASKASNTSTEREKHREVLRCIIKDLSTVVTRISAQAAGDMGEPGCYEFLSEVRQVAEEVGYLETAAVQHARDLRVTASRVAGIWGVHPSTVTREWRPSRYARQMKRREMRKQQRWVRSGTGAGPTDTARQEGHLPPPRSDSDPRPPDADLPLPLPDSHTFASALSFMLRTDERSLAELARQARVSPSYVSRILAADRFPSWRVTSRLVTACGGNEAEIRPLWNAAHDHISSAPRRVVDGTLHDTLRGLHLSAARPAAATIQAASAGKLTISQIQGLLDGDHLPDWGAVRSLVLALRGRPEMVQPLWEAAAAHRRPAPPLESPIPFVFG